MLRFLKNLSEKIFFSIEVEAPAHDPIRCQNTRSIKKKYVFNTYMESIHYINLLAEKAEENNPHPDLVVGWCKIGLVFTSHALGGVTQLCIKMAKEAEKIFSSIESS